MASGTARGYIAAFIDKFSAWRMGLPPEVCSYTVSKLHIPVADKVDIAAYLYRPTIKPYGTVLVRTPYGIEFPSSLASARVLAARGYQVLFSSCRGVHGSTGEFEPFQNERADGFATVAWMRKQSWYTGSFATLGGSYLGYNQWALLTDPPEDMKTAIIWSGLHDVSDFAWGTGALASHIIAWADIIEYINRKENMISMILHLRAIHGILKPVYDSVPLANAIEKHFGGETPQILKGPLDHPDMEDEFWEPMKQGSGVEKSEIPILLTTGWDDALLANVMWQYERLVERGQKVALMIGPWTHLGSQTRNSLPEGLKWLDEYFAGRTPGDRKAPVRVFVTGVREWRDLKSWPPATSSQELYLDAERKLSPEVPSSGIRSSSFDFDPANPTPSVGIPLPFDNGLGRKENTNILTTRPDVLVFETEPLKEDTEVCGKPVVELHHSTDHPFADILLLLSEVNAEGDFARNISEKYLRLSTDSPAGLKTFALTDCAHRFAKGTKIRLVVGGGSHPRYIRNLGTGEDQVRGKEMQVVKHTVRHEEGALSRLVLPVTKVS